MLQAHGRFFMVKFVATTMIVNIYNEKIILKFDINDEYIQVDEFIC